MPVGRPSSRPPLTATTLPCRPTTGAGSRRRYLVRALTRRATTTHRLLVRPPWWRPMRRCRRARTRPSSSTAATDGARVRPRRHRRRPGEAGEDLVVVLPGSSLAEPGPAHGVGGVDAGVDRHARRGDVATGLELARCGSDELLGLACVGTDLGAVTGLVRCGLATADCSSSSSSARTRPVPRDGCRPRAGGTRYPATPPRPPDLDDLDGVAGQPTHFGSPVLDRVHPGRRPRRSLGRTTTTSTSLWRSPPGERGTRRRSRSTVRPGESAARTPISLSTVSVDRARARSGPDAMCSGTKRNSEDGGTSRRSMTPSSTRCGSTRDACAWLTPARRATVRRFSSAVVSTSTARTRPCTPGMTASIGWAKSTLRGYALDGKYRTNSPYLRVSARQRQRLARAAAEISPAGSAVAVIGRLGRTAE